MFMKKFLIIVVISALYSNVVHGMLPKQISDTIKSGVHYVSKWVDPQTYILDSQNAKLYQSVLSAINEKTVKDLRLAQFPDQDNFMHTFESTLGKRVAERLATLTDCVLQQSLIQDPIRQDDTKLSDMIDVNRLIIPDLFLALALRSLQEQKNQKIAVNNSGSLIVDVLLHKISLLSATDQLLLKSKLQDNDKHITVEQKRDLAEAYFFSLPTEERDKLLTKMSNKKVIPMPITNLTNQIHNNSNSKSLGNDGAMSNSLGSENKANLIPVANPSPQINHNGNSSKSLDSYGNSLGSENGEIYSNNYHENGEQVTNTNDHVYYG